MEHYHIRWSSNGGTNLDWQRFANQEEAQDSARELVKPGEDYVIEQHDGDCPRCAEQTRRFSKILEPVMVSQSWIQAYQATIDEIDPSKLHELVMAAETAILLRYQELPSEKSLERESLDRACDGLLQIKTERLGWPRR
jgi:hypothetical protein